MIGYPTYTVHYNRFQSTYKPVSRNIHFVLGRLYPRPSGISPALDIEHVTSTSTQSLHAIAALTSIVTRAPFHVNRSFILFYVLSTGRVEETPARGRELGTCMLVDINNFILLAQSSICLSPRLVNQYTVAMYTCQYYYG